MTNGEFIEHVYRCAHKYALEAREVLARNSHMHDLEKCEVESISDEQIRAVLNDCFRHRIKLSYEANADGVTTDHVVKEIAGKVAVA